MQKSQCASYAASQQVRALCKHLPPQLQYCAALDCRELAPNTPNKAMGRCFRRCTLCRCCAVLFARTSEMKPEWGNTGIKNKRKKAKGLWTWSKWEVNVMIWYKNKLWHAKCVLQFCFVFSFPTRLMTFWEVGNLLHPPRRTSGTAIILTVSGTWHLAQVIHDVCVGHSLIVDSPLSES